MRFPNFPDRLLLPGKTNLRGRLEKNVGMVAEVNVAPIYWGSIFSPREENVGMVAEVQAQTVSDKAVGGDTIILRIGVAQNPPVRLTLSAEIYLSLDLAQAGKLAEVLHFFALVDEFPEESVRFEFKGDSSSKKFGAPIACVKRPDSSLRLPVEARLTRTSKSALTMALEAPKQDEDGVWHASVRITRPQAHLFAYMILANYWRVEALQSGMAGRRKRRETATTHLRTNAGSD
jgi:hypothetical protein